MTLPCAWEESLSRWAWDQARALGPDDQVTPLQADASPAEIERRIADGFIESLPGLFYLYDDQGRFLRWNHLFEAVSGYSASEIAHMHPLEFFAESDHALLRERIQVVFERGLASVEAPFLTKAGRKIPHLFTGRRIVLRGVPCLVGVGVDLSQRHAAKEALARTEARFKSTLDGILEGCQILDFDWRYTYLNDAAASHNRRPNAELLGQRMPDAWPGIEASPVFAMLRRVMEERVPLHDEVDFAFADGSRGWFDVRAQPIPEGVFVLSIDISQRKEVERELRELNERLEAKVQERTAELEAAKVRAEAADRLKSTFLATMSHELRTPLNSIIGFTGILLQGLAGPLNAEQSKQLGMVKGSARHLLDLINDVLDISKIEAGQMEMQPAPFDWRESIERVAATVRPLVEKKGLTLNLAIAPDGPSSMLSDRRRVEQILLNLLNNAIKFTDQGRIALTASAAWGTLKVTVEDTGIGIKEADLARLFQPFKQVDAGLGRQHEGTGLGLAICRRLATLLGGDISVESQWGRGSAFTMTLPLAVQVSA